MVAHHCHIIPDFNNQVLWHIAVRHPKQSTDHYDGCCRNVTYYTCLGFQQPSMVAHRCQIPQQSKDHYHGCCRSVTWDFNNQVWWHIAVISYLLKISTTNMVAHCCQSCHIKSAQDFKYGGTLLSYHTCSGFQQPSMVAYRCLIPELIIPA